MTTDAPTLDPQRFPRLSGVERPFFEYWWQHVVRPDDPQRLRWAELEEKAIENVARYVDRLAAFMPLVGKRVLDIGCQNGATLVALIERGARATGIEIKPTCVEAAAIRMRCHGVQADVRVGSACAMPYADGSFDAALVSNVIEHVEDPRALIRECARVLVPGGVLYLDGPNRFSPGMLWSDPHYQLAGVSILPGWLARAYTTRVRGFPSYDAETFPVATQTVRWLKEDGFELLDGHPRSFAGGLLANLRKMFVLVARKR